MIWVDQNKGEEVTYQKTINVSAGGMLFDLGWPHPVGTAVKLTFSLPGDSEVFDVAGRILHADWEVDKPRIGVGFTRLSDHERRAINRFIVDYDAKSPVESVLAAPV